MNRLFSILNKDFRKKIYNFLKYLIGWPVSIISLIYIGSIVYSNKASLASIGSVNLELLSMSLLTFFIYFFLRALLWNEIIKEKGNKLPFKMTVYFWEISEIKRYTPGNIWSFLSRSVLFTDKNLTNKEVLGSIINEMYLIVLGCLTISLFYIASLIKNPFLTGLLIVATIVFVFVYAFSGKLEHFFPKSGIFIHIRSLVLPGENVLNNLKLYLLSTLTFAMFGLATYFSAVSLFNLNLAKLNVLTGLFVFSLLVGYLTLITPMGLGVREGVMTLGLSSFLTTSSAGLVSIFTRIIFIISEVIFLLLTILWVKIKNRFLTPAEIFISNHKFGFTLFIFVLLFFAYFSLAGFLRYDNFYTGRFDLGNMDQTVWNTIHGRIFQTTDPNGTDMVSRLAYHADFILVLISPLYLLWSNPKMLILLQVVVMCFGALYLYLIAQEISKEKLFSLGISISFLLYPAVQYNLLYDFHGVTLATTFLLATFYYFYKRKYLYFLLFALLAGITKEQVWSIIAIFGAVIFLRSYVQTRKINKESLFGIFIFLIGSFTFYELIWKIIPMVRGGNHFALAYFSDFGNTTSSVVLNVFLNPLKTIGVFLRHGNLVYYLEMLAPLGFTTLLFIPGLIFAVPDIFINCLSSNPQLHEIYYQYSSTITPFIFISSIFGAKLLVKRIPLITYGMLTVYLVLTTLATQYFVGPMPGTLSPSIDMFANQLVESDRIQNFLNAIPIRYSIAATNNLGSHLSRRRNIYTIPNGVAKADVILFLLDHGYNAVPASTEASMVKEMENDKNYIQVYKYDSFIVFEKKSLYSKPKPKKGQVVLFPYSITALMDREYEKSDISIVKQVATNGNFNSFIISYTSDGLKEYALMNIPKGTVPQKGFPVLLLDHGYIDPKTYNTVDSYSAESTYFANRGFLVIKPDYRGNGNSEIADTALMRFAYPIDVLNLLASVSNIKEADTNQIFFWSHSMGGEVTLTALEVINAKPKLFPKVSGAVFWAPVTDPVQWFAKSHLPYLEEGVSPYIETFKIMGTPESNPDLWQSVSPLNYLKFISIPVLFQQGTGDTTVPYTWSVEINNDMKSLQKKSDLILYPDDNHNLLLHWSEAVSADITFFRSLQK